jgi:hypothetical protein
MKRRATKNPHTGPPTKPEKREREPADERPRRRALSPWAEKVITSSWSRPELSELEVVIGLVRWSGGDPKVILREWLKEQTKDLADAGPRLVTLLEAEYERILEGRKARGPLNEAHRKALKRTLDLLRGAGHIPQKATTRSHKKQRLEDLLSIFKQLSIVDTEKKSPLWDALREDDEEAE